MRETAISVLISLRHGNDHVTVTALHRKNHTDPTKLKRHLHTVTRGQSVVRKSPVYRLKLCTVSHDSPTTMRPAPLAPFARACPCVAAALTTRPPPPLILTCAILVKHWRHSAKKSCDMALPRPLARVTVATPSCVGAETLSVEKAWAIGRT